MVQKCFDKKSADANTSGSKDEKDEIMSNQQPSDLAKEL